MKCPVCKESTLVMTERQGIEIDYCPQCRGVWLDRGELDKIIERSQRQEAANAPQQAGRPLPQPESDDQNDGHHNGGKHQGRHGPMQGRKSFWKEIFD